MEFTAYLLVYTPTNLSFLPAILADSARQSAEVAVPSTSSSSSAAAAVAHHDDRGLWHCAFPWNFDSFFLSQVGGQGSRSSQRKVVFRCFRFVKIPKRKTPISSKEYAKQVSTT